MDDTEIEYSEILKRGYKKIGKPVNLYNCEDSCHHHGECQLIVPKDHIIDHSDMSGEINYVPKSAMIGMCEYNLSGKN